MRKTYTDNYAELNIIKYNITDTADLQDGLVMGFEDEQFEYNGITVILPSKELVLQSKQYNVHAENVCL